MPADTPAERLRERLTEGQGRLLVVATASNHKGEGLAGLWNVSTPGGAFVWPSRDGEAPPTPHIADDLFISLNMNSTYGPTSKALVSCKPKPVMTLQILLAIVMLTVPIARAVSSTS